MLGMLIAVNGARYPFYKTSYLKKYVVNLSNCFRETCALCALIDMTDVVSGQDRALTTKQLAQYLGISARSLEQFRVDGGGPKFVKLGADKFLARVVSRWSDVQA